MKKLSFALIMAFMGLSFTGFSQFQINLENNTNCNLTVQLYGCTGNTTVTVAKGTTLLVNSTAATGEFQWAEVTVGNGCMSFTVITDIPNWSPCTHCASGLAGLSGSNNVTVSGGCKCASSVSALWLVDCTTETGEIIFS